MFDRHRQLCEHHQTKHIRTFETEPRSSRLGCEQFTNYHQRAEVADPAFGIPNQVDWVLIVSNFKNKMLGTDFLSNFRLLVDI